MNGEEYERDGHKILEDDEFFLPHTSAIEDVLAISSLMRCLFYNPQGPSVFQLYLTLLTIFSIRSVLYGAREMGLLLSNACQKCTPYLNLNGSFIF